MTPDQADELLRSLGLFDTKNVEEHFQIGCSMIGDEAMFSLADHLNGEFDFSEDYLLEKCGEDPYFSIIHSMKFQIFREELIWLDKILPENALIFDLGCNSGHITALCAQMRRSCRFVGYDTLALPLKKANQIKQDRGLNNLSFENYDVFNLSTNPKPDGLIILQALGPFLTDTNNISKLCNLADQKAFIVLVEAFTKQRILRSVVEGFQENGFNLVAFNKLACGKGRKIKEMPALFLARGMDDKQRLEVSSIKL